MKKLYTDQANAAIEQMFQLGEGTLKGFVLVTADDTGGDIFSSMCCDVHTVQALTSSIRHLIPVAEAHPN